MRSRFSRGWILIWSALTALVLVALVDGVGGCNERAACRDRGGVVVNEPCIPSLQVCSTNQYGKTQCSHLSACGWHCTEP